MFRAFSLLVFLKAAPLLAAELAPAPTAVTDHEPAPVADAQQEHAEPHQATPQAPPVVADGQQEQAGPHEVAPVPDAQQAQASPIEVAPPAGERSYPDHAPLAEKAPGTGRKRTPLVFLPDLASLASFVAEDPKATEMVRAMEHRLNVGTGLSLGTSVISGVMLGLGIVLPRECTALADDPSRCRPDLNWGLLLGGAATSIVGQLISLWILPGVKDFQAVADVWNAGIPEEDRPQPAQVP